MMIEANEGQENLEVTESSETPSTQDTSAADAQAQAIFDLDKVDKFRFGGNEWTAKDLQASIMRQADYSRKTQEFAQERKYYENLHIDLQSVKDNPQLVDKFKSIYPQAFHRYVEGIKPAQTPNDASQKPAYLNEYEKRLEQVEAQFKEKEVEAATAKVDQIFNEMKTKYPRADEELVLARATALNDRGTKLTDEVWDTIWKQAHTKTESGYKEYYSKQVKEQSKASSKAKDIGSGGGIPGEAPKRMTMKEATEAAIRDLSGANA